MKLNIHSSFTKVKIIILLILILSIFLIIIVNMSYKKNETGNNKTSQEIVQNILNISEYHSKIEVEIVNNRSTTKYIIEQEYKDGIEKHIVKEPKNIEGITIINEGNTLKIEDSVLNITKIINSYEYISDNCLDLSSFIKEYKESNNQKYEENEQYIIMKVDRNGENRYTKQKLLYIDKNTYEPVKMQIKDTNNNTRIDIKYSEINIK